MAKQITQVGVLKNVLTGTELVEIQEASGGFGSSKRTTVQAIANLVVVPAAPVQSVQGRYGDVVIDKTDVALGNVDNTSDVDKPVSTAQQAALDLKADIAGQVFEGTVDAPELLEGGVQVVTVGTFDGHFDTRLAAVLSSTTQLPEGDNLYYTESRVDARIEELRTNTDDLPEGSANKYFTGLNLYNQIVTSTGVYKTYDAGTGLVYIIGEGSPGSPAVVMVNGQQGVVELTTDEIPEGAVNKYFNGATSSEVAYDNSNSGLSAEDTQAAIDEIVADGTLNGVNTLSIVAGVVTLDCSLGDYFILTLTEDVVSWSIVNLPAGKGASKLIKIVQDMTPRTVAWVGSGFKWAGAAGSVSTSAGAIDLLAISSFTSGEWLANIGKGYV